MIIEVEITKRSSIFKSINHSTIMKKQVCLFFFIFSFMYSFAQMRISANAGPVLNTKNVKQDSAFFSNKSFNEQIKIGYHIGKLGLVLSTTLIQQKAGNVVEENRIPKFPTLQGVIDSAYVFTGGVVNTSIITFAPQICFPTGKLKINLSVGIGMAITKATDATVLLKSNASNNTNTLYNNSIDNALSPAITSAINFQMPITKKIAFDVNMEYLSYAVSFKNKDRRNGNTVVSKKDQKKLVSIKSGLTYRF